MIGEEKIVKEEEIGSQKDKNNFKIYNADIIPKS